MVLALVFRVWFSGFRVEGANIQCSKVGAMGKEKENYYLGFRHLGLRA